MHSLLHNYTFIDTILIIQANGMGKTTTIGKLAHRLRTEGNQTVLMAACDTFRAGAVEQLQQWADRAEVDMVGPTEKITTPSAVLYSALDKAVEAYDTVSGHVGSIKQQRGSYGRTGQNETSD
jgi:fused signal recognition particle receptor